jgi:hypothetical protein
MPSSLTGNPTEVNLNSVTPPAVPDAINVFWQAGAAYPDPNDPTKLVRDTSAFYFPAPVGGDVILAADYQMSAVDSGFTFIANSATPITITLPPAPPTLNPGEGVWYVKIKNFGSGVLTVDPNGMNLDGTTATRTLAQGSGFEVSTDGTDYWTYGNFGAASNFADAEVPTPPADGSTTIFNLAHTPLATPIVEVDELMPVRGASSAGYTLVGTTLTFTDPPQRSIHVWYRY